MAGARSEYVTAKVALQLLGVKPATLYTYVSRGWISRVRARSGRGNLYLRTDLLRLKARHDARAGHAAVAASALRWGEPVIDSAITTVRGGVLYYRGHDALELARRGVRYEDVAELLWTGALREPRLEPEWPELAPPLPGSRVRAVLRDGAGPVRAMLCAVALLRARSPRVDGEAEPEERARARALIRWLARGPGWGRSRSQRASASVAESCAAALGVSGDEPARAIELALIVIADHELNPSTFAARVAASAGSDLYACTAAGLATLSGPRHGGATLRVEALLEQTVAARRASDVVRERLARGARLPGFGHPLYPDGDPRARALLEHAAQLGARGPRSRVLRAIERAAADAGLPPPNVDFGLVALTEALGLRPSSALFVFAVGRLAGWVAHVLEQRAQGEQLRPRARYTGVLP